MPVCTHTLNCPSALPTWSFLFSGTAESRFGTPGTSRTERGLFSFPRSFACRSEQWAIQLLAVLFGRVSHPGLSLALPLQNWWKCYCLIPATFLKSWSFWLITFPCSMGIYLQLAILLGDALALDAGWVLRKVCLSVGQIAINKLQYFVMKQYLTSRGQLEVMVLCCLEWLTGQ